MAIRDVLRMGDPRLLRRAEPVADLRDPALLELLADMRDTMRSLDGAGLAAPQIGVPLQVVIFGLEHNPRYPDAAPVPDTVLINPVITPIGAEIEDGWEGCLSVPGMRGLVPRWRRLRYAGVDEHGVRLEREVEGFHARVVQHEVDHLLGVLYPMRIQDLRNFGFLDAFAPGRPPGAMKLHQLRYLVSVADNDLNITAAAKALHTSQPGVSKQLKMLEDELGFRIFVREGRALVRVTPPGTQVISRARHIVREIGNIRGLAAELRKDEDGSLSIATTHTQARYVLPAVLKRFRQEFPGVRLHLHQGTSEQIAEMVDRDRVDFVIATGGDAIFTDLVRLPCYRWRRVIVVPADHPLANVAAPTVAQLAQHPIITYSFSFTGPSSLLDLFAKAGETPNVALTAWDSDVIKEYIRAGLGVGILADVAVDPEGDPDLRVRSATHLFEPHTTWIGFRRGALLRSYSYEFMAMVAPHLTRRRVQAVEDSESQDAVDSEFEDVVIPFKR